MNSDPFQILLMLFMFMSGGPSNQDALDMIPTDAYWHNKSVTVSVEQLRQDASGKPQAPIDSQKLIDDLASSEFAVRETAKKKLEAGGIALLPALRQAALSKDPEVAAAASDLINRLAGHIKEPDIRQLMAIRTLGQRREKSAEDLLKSLHGAPQPFVAEYTQRALDQIAGVPPKHPDRLADLAPDLALLPKDSGIVGQTTSLGIPGFSFEMLADLFQNQPQVAANQPPAPPLPGVAPLDPSAKQPLIDRLTRAELSYIERIGNLRADGATVAVSADIGGDRNWVVISFRGQYDSKAVLKLVQDLLPKGPNQFPQFNLTEVSDIPLLQLDREASILFPSDHQLVFVVVESNKVPEISVLLPVMMGMLTGKGSLDQNPQMSALVKSADKSGPIWATGIPSKAMRTNLPPLAAFDALTCTSQLTKDTVHLELHAAMKLPELAPASIAALNLMLVPAQSMLGNEKDPALDSVKAALQSLKLTATDTGAVAAADIPLDAGKSLLVENKSVLTSLVQSLGDQDSLPAPPAPMPAQLP